MQSLADAPDAAADFRRRTRWYWAIGLGQVIATVILGFGLILIWEPAAFVLVSLSMLTYLPAYVAVSVWVMRFECPRCHHRWTKRLGSLPPPFMIRCAHCGLPRD